MAEINIILSIFIKYYFNNLKSKWKICGCYSPLPKRRSGFRTLDAILKTTLPMISSWSRIQGSTLVSSSCQTVPTTVNNKERILDCLRKLLVASRLSITTLFIKFGLLIALLSTPKRPSNRRNPGTRELRCGPLTTPSSLSQTPRLTDPSSRTQLFQMITCCRIRLSPSTGEKTENGTMANSVMLRTPCPTTSSRSTQKPLVSMIDKNAMTTALKIELRRRLPAADSFLKIGKMKMAIGWSQSFIAVSFSPIWSTNNLNNSKVVSSFTPQWS